MQHRLGAHWLGAISTWDNWLGAYQVGASTSCMLTWCNIDLGKSTLCISSCMNSEIFFRKCFTFFIPKILFDKWSSILLIDKVRKWTMIEAKSKNIFPIKIQKCCHISCAKEGIKNWFWHLHFLEILKMNYLKQLLWYENLRNFFKILTQIWSFLVNFCMYNRACYVFCTSCQM